MPHRLPPPQAERFLGGRHIAVLTTVNADGTPLQTPIWYLYRDHLIYMRTAEESTKARNIRRDPRVSLCVQDERPPYRGVTVRGTASLEPPRKRGWTRRCPATIWEPLPATSTST